MSSTFDLSPEDRAAVERQLGRRVRGKVQVAVRCPCGLPAVIETHPMVDGEPFPTLYWLTCRRAISATGALEAGGRMAELNERLRTDKELARRLLEATEDYVRRRDEHYVLEGAGGVGGGPADRVKCLHAHLAHELACGGNPIGEWVLDQIGDVLREPPCV